MAEVNSRQAAKIAAGQKVANSDAGRLRTVVIQTPAVFSQLAIDDTLAGGVFIPAGSRIVNARVSCSAGTASSTFNLGLRKRKDLTVVDATAITSLQAITSASTTPVPCANGTKMAAGVDYVLADDCEVYLTAKGAVLAANQLVRIEVDYVGA